MCGIVGYFGKGNKEILARMTGVISYRGPDDEGFFVDNRVGLGQRRLSIVDVSPAGRQPMANEDGTILVNFNGEIYNHEELKKELKSHHPFRSTSDTEILLHLYEEIGEKMFEKLNGMFAISLYDSRKKKLFLARDRVGKKPLYWGVFDETLLFGSELKALLQHPLCKKELDLVSLNKYLQYEYVPTPHSIFKNIYKLEAGHILTYDGQEIKKQSFWDITFSHTTISFENAKQTLDHLLDNATKIRLMSDVPLGIFLSGGLDSSTVAYYAQKNSTQKIKTFSIGFHEKSFDELRYARHVAGHLGTEHHERMFPGSAVLGLVNELNELLDEPLGDPSLVPTYMLSQFTREQVTVALGGDGGDELLCGYDTFLGHRTAEYYEKIPRVIRRHVLEKIFLNLPTSFNNITLDFKVKKFISGLYGEKKYRSHRWLGSYDREDRKKLFLPEVWKELEEENEFEDIDRYLTKLSTNDYYQELIYLYLKTFLMDDIMTKVDRASMFNSLEVRAPILDYRVIDFLNSLPTDYKIKGFTTKYILKELMAPRLPKGIAYRKKKGFGIPLARWLTHELKDYTHELLSEERIRSQGLFNYEAIDTMVRDHYRKKKDNRKQIWTLLTFQAWYDGFYA